MSCTGLPANAQWNTVSEITQEWKNSAWTPPTTGSYDTAASTTECHFKCNNNYAWENSQCINEKVVTCPMLPANAEYNTVSEITQTYTTSGGWTPSASLTHDDTPSESACRFKCKSGYIWEDGVCRNKKTVACPTLPSGAVYNTVSSITQNWTPSGGWSPANTLTYNTEASTKYCRYKCNTNYTWTDNSYCKADSHSATCTGIPAHASPNSVSSITQTWNGSTWTPSATATYNTTESTTECRYKCDQDYHTEDGGASCTFNTKTHSCGTLPANAVWNTVSSYQQTWNASTSSWTPAATTLTHDDTASQTACRYKCKDHYPWSGSECKAETKTFTCTGLPENAQWNMGSANGSYTQTWDGSKFNPVDSTATYSTTASETSCKFKCNSGYDWINSQCIKTHYNWGFESGVDGDWISQVSNSSWVRTSSGSYGLGGYNNSSLPGPKEGSYAMCSNIQGSNSTNANLILELTIPDDPVYKGTLSFNYTGTSEESWDFLQVYLEPTQSDIEFTGNDCSGTATQILCTDGSDHLSWETVTISNLAPGKHRILFKYHKDSNQHKDADRYCIDNLSWDLTDALSCSGASLNSAPLYLKFNEGSGSTTANSGTAGGSYSISGGSWVSSVGSRGKAYNFNGSTTVSTNITKYTDNFTMMAWVKVTSGYTITLPSQSSSGTNGTSGQHYLFGANHESSNAGAGLSVGTNGIFVTAHGDSYMPPLAVYSGDIGTGWHHVAVVFNIRTPYIYLDGNLVQTGATSQRTTYSPTSVGSGSYGSFYGAVDDVRIIGSALSLEEVK